jgi:hypothetical protein
MAMVIGKGVKLEKAEKILANFASELLDGEVVWYYAKCNNFKPMLDAIVITNVRTLGLSNSEGYNFKVLHTQIATTAFDEKRGTIQIDGNAGNAITFKAVASPDVLAVAHYLEHGKQAPIPDSVSASMDARKQAQIQARGAELQAAEDRATLKAEKREQKDRARAQRIQEREDRAADEVARYGNKIADEIFGMKTIRVYDKGFVRVSLPMFGKNAPFEQLLSIEASSDVSKKSGLGRGAAAVVTAGWNLAASNKRGDVYLTITTDATTRVLHEDPPTAMNLKAVKRLEAAGLSVIGRGGYLLDDSPEEILEAPLGPTVAERLRELTRLRDEGLVSQCEYSELRAKLLGSL